MRIRVGVDLTLLTGFANDAAFVDALLAAFTPRRADAREFALTRRVLLLRTSSGVDVDVALGGLPFEERSIERASLWSWGDGQSLFTCSAEDLIVHKVFAGRDRDWGDVESVLIRQDGTLNLEQVREELDPLLELKGEPEATVKLARMIATVTRRLRAKP